MARTIGAPRVVRSVSLSLEFDNLCREHGISPSEAMRVGISVLLSEKDVSGYTNGLTVYRRLEEYQKKLAAILLEQEELKRTLASYQGA